MEDSPWLSTYQRPRPTTAPLRFTNLSQTPHLGYLLAMDGEDSTQVDPTLGDAQHLTTISHEGRFWEVFMEFEPEAANDPSCRAKFRFDPADADEGEEPARTAVIVIESSYEDAMRKARGFPDQQLGALLRSVLPEPG